MPKTRLQKEQLVQNIKEILQSAKSAVFAVFSNLKVEKINSLRKDLKQQNANLRIIKKRLLKKALADSWPEIAQQDYLQEKNKKVLGNISLTWSSDEIAAAKNTEKFTQENKNYKILGGLLIEQKPRQVKYLSYEEIKHLASLPQKSELLAKTAQTIKAPLYNLKNVLQKNINNLIGVLNQIAKIK